MSVSLRPRTAGSALALAIHVAIVGAPLLAALPAQAQQQLQRYDIPAGTLGDVLSRYAREAGVAISFNSEQVAHKRSAGLQGSYGVLEGFAALLHGQGLQAQSSPDGYVLVALPQNAGALELGATNITGAGLGSTTEGSGSYTTGATNTATKLTMSLRETPQSVSVMTRQRIDDQNLRSIGQVLEQAPGINVQSPGSDRLYVFSRGLAIDNYQFDGMPTTSFAFSQALPHALADMAIYDRVEVVRGATGLLTGAGDPSGTVNLVRKRPTDSFKGYVSGGLGSWDLYRGEVDVSGPLTETGNVRGRAVAAYQQANSFTDHLQQEKTVLYGITEFDLSDTTLLTVGASYLNNDPRGFSTTGLPVLDRYGNKLHTSRSDNPASRDSSNRQQIFDSFASIEQKLANDWSLKLSASYLYGTRDYDSVIAGTSTGFVDPATGSGLKYTATKGENWQKQKGLDLMLSGPFQAFGREHELVMGFNYQDYENRRNGFGHPTAAGGSDNLVSGKPVNIWTWDNYAPRPTYSINREDDNLTQRQNGAYLATRLKPVDDLSLVLGARVSNYKYDDSYTYNVPAMVRLNTANSTRVSGEVTPYAGVVYDLDANHSVYASYTSIFKPQTYKDRNGKVLQPREGDNYEIGLKGEYFDGRLNTAIALFEVKLDNDAIADGIIIGTDYDTAYAAKKTTTRGLDLEISGEILPGWNIDASYSHARVEDSEGERVKSLIPLDLFKLWTTYRLPGALERLTVGGGVNWQSSIHFTSESWMLPQASTYKQDDYATVGLMARYQLTPQWSATATVNNLFDKKYVSSLDENFYSGSYGEPRNVMVTSKWEF